MRCRTCATNEKHYWKALFTVSAEGQKTHDIAFDVFKRNLQEDLVDGWKRVENHSQGESARLAVSAGNKLLPSFSDVQSLPRNSLALLSSLVTKALDLSSKGNSQSAGAKKTKRPHKASGFKGPVGE